MQGAPKGKSGQGSIQKMAPTDKATLQTRGPYIQGVSTDKGALQTSGDHRQGVHTDKGPLQQKTPIDDV